jgi:hypothetical protein
MPGFSFCKSVTDSPQLLEKLAHVAPASAVVAKSQLTARGARAAPIAGTAPTARRAVRCIVRGLNLGFVEKESLSEISRWEIPGLHTYRLRVNLDE